MPGKKSVGPDVEIAVQVRPRLSREQLKELKEEFKNDVFDSFERHPPEDPAKHVVVKQRPTVKHPTVKHPLPNPVGKRPAKRKK